MTIPRYPQGCAAGSEVLGTAAPASYAWNVNLNNGNSNRNHIDNHNHARAVCAGECHGAVSFQSLYFAWREARRGKKPSVDQLNFECRWLDELLDLQERLNAGTWHPSAPTCFIAQAPKAREIHAPTFADRVVHHLVVPPLEAIYEPTFIHDSYSNRRGKGTHAAVRHLQRFVRQVDSGQGDGSYLQLDIANCFNSIDRRKLWELLKLRMERAGLPIWLQHAVHALLNWPLSRTGVRWACTESERAVVPPHKRLENAAPGCGIAIGNLSSQFFANIYLDRLDQFVKHELKVKRYLRYVDDFVLVHRDAAQLEIWRQRIAEFLASELRMELKAEQILRPLHAGIDFLGYVIYPTHTVVRRRVIAHARAKLADWAHHHVWAGVPTRLQQPLERLRCIWASYAGHFSHAASYRLRERLIRRFPWLCAIMPEEPK